MRLEQLKYLVAVAQFGSINKASKKLHITQQSLNASLKKLESEIGHTLLIRSAQGVTLSERGQLLVETSKNLLQEINDCLMKMDELETPITTEHKNKHIKDNLTLLVSPIIATNLLQPIIKTFSSNYPSINLTVIEDEASEIISRIATGDGAFGLATSLTDSLLESAAIDPNHSIIAKTLFTEKLYAIVSINHPLAKQKTVSLKTLLKYPLAIYQSNKDIYNPVHHLLSSHGNPNFHLITNNQDVYKQSILSKDVIGFGNKALVKTFSDTKENVIFIPIKNVPPVNIFYLYNQNYFHQHQQSLSALLKTVQLFTSK